MGDMGEVFNELKKIKKAKRAKNTVDSTAILTRHGIQFESKNGGAHLLLQHLCGPVDFWPSTGLWTVRHSKKRFRGIRSLLSYYGIENA